MQGNKLFDILKRWSTLPGMKGLKVSNGLYALSGPNPVLWRGIRSTLEGQLARDHELKSKKNIIRFASWVTLRHSSRKWQWNIAYRCPNSGAWVLVDTYAGCMSVLAHQKPQSDRLCMVTTPFNEDRHPVLMRSQNLAPSYPSPVWYIETKEIMHTHNI